MKPKQNPSRFLIAWSAVFFIGTPMLKADLKLTFNKGGDNTTPTGTITVDLGSSSASMSNLTGGGGLKEPTVSGVLPGLSGSFDIHFQALGTNADNLDPSDFTGGLATGVHSGTNATWAANSDLNSAANNAPGQGIVFTFDFSNLIGSSGIDLKAVRWNNDGGGCRLSFRDEGVGASTPLHSGGGVNSANQTITFAAVQEIDSDDQIAFWSGGGGQKRLAEFTFGYIPTGIVPPTGLTASTNGAQVNLDWDDDLSGTLGFYTVKRSETQGGPYTQIATNVPTSDFIDTTVVTGTTYYYVLTATDSVGPTESVNSGEVSSFVRIQPPSGLTRVQGEGLIDLDWNDDTSGIFDFYTVYRSETSGGPYTQIATNLTSSDFADTTVINNTTYFYVVTATDDLVPLESVSSDEVFGTAFVPVAGSALYAHLDGSDAGSITADGSDIVSLWADQTGNGLDATSEGGVGTVFYPSLDQSETGLEGVDFGFTSNSSRSTLVWFSPAEQDGWLNFTDGSAAAPYSGFAVFAVVYPASILGGSNRDVVLSSTENDFSLRYEGGRPQVRLGSAVLQGSAVVTAGEAVVLAVNYNAASGLLELWDSQSGSTSTATVPLGDFSSAADMFLGGSVNSDQYMAGFIGEMKLYRGAMTPAEFSAERLALGFKWKGLQAPAGLVASSGDGEVRLDWQDQVADSYTVYRSESEGGPYARVATDVPTNNYTDSTVTAGITYYYVVSATKDGQEGPESAELAVTPYNGVIGSTLFAHLDGSNSGNLTADENDIISLWSDLTTNGRDASSAGGFGTVFYPSLDASESGLGGVDFGFTAFVAPATNPKSSLLWFDELGQDAWLDFSDISGAGLYSGFAVFAVVHPTAILGGINRDVVMGSTESFFSIRYENGKPQVRLGPGSSPTILQGTAGAAKVGETLVIAVNYNAVTGQLQLWDSESGLTTSATRAAADFSSPQGLFLGGSVNSDQYMEGMIGEVKVYRGSMAPAEFSAEQAGLVAKWITGATGTDFATWITGTFANGKVTRQGPDDDDDGDGIANLLEFAIDGEDPTVTNALVGRFSELTLSFIKRPGANGLAYAIEESIDLGGVEPWQEVSGVSYINDATTISYTLPGGPTKNFMRLRVTEP